MLIPMVLAASMLHPEWTVSRVLELAPVRFIGRIFQAGIPTGRPPRCFP